MSTPELKKIAEGREAEIFSWEVGAVLKLFRGPEWEPSVAVQSAAMTVAKSAGAPVPAVYGRTEVDGRPGLIMERIDGTDQLTQIGRRPWTILAAGRTLGDTQATLHDVIIEDGVLPDLRRALRAALQTANAAVIPPHIATLAVAALDALPAGDRLLHGDYHPANLIMGPTGPVVIDWPNAVRGDPHADVARTLLLVTLGELPPGSSWVLRGLDRVGRGMLQARYLSAYRARRALDDELVARWRVPVAAHRLIEQVGDERSKLIAILEEAAR